MRNLSNYLKSSLVFATCLSFSHNLLAQSAGSDDKIGMCPQNINSTNGSSDLFQSYKALRIEIQASRIKIEKQVATNSNLVLTDFRAPTKTLKFIRNLHTARPVLEKLVELLTDPKLKAIRDSDSFSAMLGSQDFLNFVVNTDFTKYADTAFAELMTGIQNILKQPYVLQSMAATATSDIDLSNLDTVNGGIELDNLLAQQNLDFLNKNLQTLKQIELIENSDSLTEEGKQKASELRKQVALTKDIPFPNPLKIKGQIADSYRALLAQEYERFLKFYNNGIMTYATSVFDDNDNMSASTITFDSWILPLFDQPNNTTITYAGGTKEVSPAEMVAIDALSRTLYGEINTCESKGIEQATLVAKIVSDRANAIKFSESRSLQNIQSIENSVDASEELLKDHTGIITAAEFTSTLKTTSVATYGGKFDFGRPDSGLNPLISNPVTQAVSRGDQFSGWRSVSKTKVTIPAKHANIPQTQITINRELSEGDISALYNQLCPDRSSQRWQRMVKLAKSVVLDPDFSKKVKWNQALAQAPLFYTHAVPLTFVSEIPLPNLVDNRTQEERMTPSATVKYNSQSAACPQVRLWVSNNKQRYFPNPAVVP